jgi:hypothetical protein
MLEKVPLPTTRCWGIRSMSRPGCREPRLQERSSSEKRLIVMSSRNFSNAPCRELELKGKSDLVPL